MHALPQKPQLVGSVCTLAQFWPQAIKPVAHIDEHVPFEQKGAVAGHAFPHAPQLRASDAMLAQPVGHACRPAVHVHCPLVQLCWAPQALLHMPQWRKSVASVVQVPLQLVVPFKHIGPPPVPTAPPTLPPMPAPDTPPVPPPLSSESSEFLVSVPWAEQLAAITKNSPKIVSPTEVRMAQFLAYPAIPCNRKSADIPAPNAHVVGSGTDSSRLRICTRRRKRSSRAFSQRNASREITKLDG
jgi:hypothetical protein